MLLKKGNIRKIYIEEPPLNNMTNTGIAYGFFYYMFDTEDIREEIPDLRDVTKVPKELTLDLIKGVENVDTSADSQLAEIVNKAKRSKMNHVFKATLPNSGNRRVANKLGNLLNGLYQSANLYDIDEPFCAGIVYKRGEKYVFRRDN